ncbi:MAG: T9SS type A sorting domain-containing protein, partial [Bacteroidota bacterium]
YPAEGTNVNPISLGRLLLNVGGMTTSSRSLAPIPLDLSPNPTAETLLVRGGSLSEPYQILDAAGRQIRTGTMRFDGQLDVSDLRPGVYLLRVGELGYGRFVKR